MIDNNRSNKELKNSCKVKLQVGVSSKPFLDISWVNSKRFAASAK